jgi:hypothetical protein
MLDILENLEYRDKLDKGEGEIDGGRKSFKKFVDDLRRLLI